MEEESLLFVSVTFYPIRTILSYFFVVVWKIKLYYGDGDNDLLFLSFPLLHSILVLSSFIYFFHINHLLLLYWFPFITILFESFLFSVCYNSLVAIKKCIYSTFRSQKRLIVTLGLKGKKRRKETLMKVGQETFCVDLRVFHRCKPREEEDS